MVKWSEADLITYVDKVKEKLLNGEMKLDEYDWSAQYVMGRVRLFPVREHLVKLYRSMA